MPRGPVEQTAADAELREEEVGGGFHLELGGWDQVLDQLFRFLVEDGVVP